ncbi:efflux RND transporter permease subunit [Salinispirillum marinum]|uniref:Efflux RND transporter permease subunit n=2 Tax=Saccharospirillaceae TaxID=255527 RepID=A0ABV8BGS4_9GAMM
MSGLIHYFAGHRVAANILMFLTILAGAWGLQQVNFQLLPTFEFQSVNVNARWEGASTEDVQNAITIPLEATLLGLPEVARINSTSTEGSASLRISVTEGYSTDEAITALEDAIAGVGLPDGVDTPSVRQFAFRETVGSVLVYGDAPPTQLSDLAREYAAELRGRGIAEVSINGTTNEFMTIEVPSDRLLQLDMTLNELAQIIRQQNANAPAGTLTTDGLTLQLRAQGESRLVTDLARIPIRTHADGGITTLGDVARFTSTIERGQEVYYQGYPAVVLNLSRQDSDNSLAVARIMNEWLDDTRPELPAGVALHTYRESWKTLMSRLNMVLENGIMGMFLVIGVLFLFLNTRLAFWVAAGIPISFLATFLVMGVSNITVNIISLFGFMMALGIIVDDAIVVAEDTQAQRDQGANSHNAAYNAARRMFPPVLASSLTTIAAFLPLMLVGGRFGSLMADIPLVVICAILASLIECFLILPAHLHHALKNSDQKKPSRFRQTIDRGFLHFRDRIFRPLVTFCVNHGAVTICAMVAAGMISFGLVRGGHVPWTPFPSLEGSNLSASVNFTPDSDPQQVTDYLNGMERALSAAANALNYEFVETAVVTVRPENLSGSISVEMVNDVDRPYTSLEIMNAWKDELTMVPGLQNVLFTRARQGLGASDVSINLTGNDIEVLKDASLELQQRLVSQAGMTDPQDDLPLGSEQLRFSLSLQAQALGLTLTQVSSYLSSQLQGVGIQDFIVGGQTVPLRLQLPESETSNVRAWESLPYPLPGGGWANMGDLLNSEYRLGIDRLQRSNGSMGIMVSADAANADELPVILAYLENELLPELAADFGITVALAGEQEDAAETARAFQLALVIALALMYMILTWVFSSWTWPFVVLVTIPFGLTGAIVGHWIMDMQLSFLSLFGLFGLAGIVVNDSIVLVTFYRRLREEGMALRDAVIEAACQRLRAVLLTSITTIAGLTPILFATSLDAQFLQPMAAGIVFGLLFSTLLILLLVPTLLLWMERATTWVTEWSLRRHRVHPGETF